MRPLQSQPVNWGGTDFGLNRGGQIMGQALANTGGLLGNAIMEHAQKEEEKRKKKEQEDAAIAFMKTQGMDEAQARNVVKGIGIENWSRFQQIDQQKKESDARMQAMAAEKAAMEAKAAEAFRKAQQAEQENSILKNVMAGGAPAGTPPPYLAKNGSDAARMDGNAFANRMATMGMPAEKALEYGGKIASMQPKKEENVEFFTDPETGRRFVKGPVQQLSNVPTERPAPSSPPYGSERQTPIGDKVYTETWDGRQWVDKGTHQPLFTKHEVTGEMTPNPLIFGVNGLDVLMNRGPANAAVGTTGKYKWTRTN